MDGAEFRKQWRSQRAALAAARRRYIPHAKRPPRVKAGMIRLTQTPQPGQATPDSQPQDPDGHQ